MTSVNFEVLRKIRRLLLIVVAVFGPFFIVFDVVPSIYHFYVPSLLIVIPFEIYYHKKWKEWKKENYKVYEIHP